MDYQCPDCHHTLSPAGDMLQCHSCHKNFRLTALCPDCQQPLEVLKACGAVDYFCQNGHGLISKKRVVLMPVAA